MNVVSSISGGEGLVTYDKDKGIGITDSLKIARKFGKRHANVMRDIRNLKCSDEFALRNFELCLKTKELEVGSTRQEYYKITKDGFTFLVMGYTGELAAKFKEKFITAFNEMNELLNSDEFIELRYQQIQQKRMAVLENKLAEKEKIIELQQSTIKEQAPKVEYVDRVLDANNLIITNTIAKELGTSARTLNKFLQEENVIYRMGSTYYLYSKYQDKGYVGYKTSTHPNSYGQEITSHLMCWTEKGREFIHTNFRDQFDQRKAV